MWMQNASSHRLWERSAGSFISDRDKDIIENWVGGSEALYIEDT